MNIAKVVLFNSQGKVITEYKDVVDIGITTKEHLLDTVWDWEYTDETPSDERVNDIVERMIHRLSYIGEYSDTDNLWEIYRDVCKELSK